MAGVTVWTIGHSGHATGALVDLLRLHGVDAVVDVRSAPYSRIHPQHAKGPLSAALEAAGIGYRFAGQHLGGRPHDPALYDADGHVRYDRLSQTAAFERGIERLLELAADQRVCLLCAEEDPVGCHRRLLVARVVADRGGSVTHIRGDGSTIEETELVDQPDLFGTWRSTAPVPPVIR